jgi:isoquinoline 1-oxidoreductase subunit beta
MKNIHSRRNFLKSASSLAGGLVVGFNWFETKGFEANITNPAMIESLNFNSYLSIETTGKVIILSPNPEIGQGIKTAFPIIVADELDVDWKDVIVKQADLDKKFDRQLTGGSGAIKHSWERLRKAGATARYLLKEAAAQKWGVSSTELKTEKGFVIHSSGKKLSYGELADAASKIKAPENVTLKKISEFSLIGSTIKGVDNPELLVGKPLFGIDLKKEGMVHAQIQRPPAFGMKLKSFDATEAKKMSGIVDVVSFGNKVAIVGKSTWEIMQARKVLKVEWEKDQTLESTADHNRIFTDLMNKSGAEVRRKDGDVETAFKNATKVIEAEYQCPFIPHNCMEPMNFFAHVKADGTVEMAGPTQTPAASQGAVAKLLNIPADKISIEITKQGGGFGRRLNTDYAVEAAELSSIIKKPVKVLWTREDDMTGGIFRPAAKYRFRAALDKSGNMIGFHLKGVGMNTGNPVRQDNFPVGAVENVLVETFDHKSPITTGPWRAPITNFLAYAEQSFLDEVAVAAGKDPIAFRIELLEKALKNPVGKLTYEPKRFIETMNLVAQKANWGKQKKGIHQGFAVYFSHNSYVAQIAQIEVKKGKPTLQKVYAATDCGIVINQSGARNQIYGAIVDGFGHAMFGNLNFKDGVPQESNYDKYRLIRFNEIPEIEAYFVDNGIDPTGLGEPALPPTGGAIANAIFKATGKRLYSQPFILADQKVEGIV